MWTYIKTERYDGLVQDCGISIANAMEIPQSCTEPSTDPDINMKQTEHFEIFKINIIMQFSPVYILDTQVKTSYVKAKY